MLVGAKPVKQTRRRKYQYRVVWGYKGRPGERRMVKAENPYKALRTLRRMATTEPWMGATEMNVRRGWARLSYMLGVPFETVSGIPPREVMRRIQAAYPELDFIRVEFRQVGPWTELLDPLANLVTVGGARADKRMNDFYDKIEQMTPADLDAWRSIPAGEADEQRAQHGRVRRLPNRFNRAATAAPKTGD
mgnify:CR=1 FL=1